MDRNLKENFSNQESENNSTLSIYQRLQNRMLILINYHIIYKHKYLLFFF